MNLSPSRKGQTFTANGNPEVLTARAFFGESGIEYPTAKEAFDNNPDSKKKGWCCVKNEEYGGASNINYCNLVNQSKNT